MKAWIGFLDANDGVKDLGWTLIKLFTNNPVHVFMMFEEPFNEPGQESDKYSVYEASNEGITVQSWKNRDDNDGAEVHEVYEICLSQVDLKKGLDFAHKEMGVPYDFTALPWFGFCLIPENTVNFFRQLFSMQEIKIRWKNIFQVKNRLFCSEFATHDLRAMGLRLEDWMRGNNVLPKDLREYARNNPVMFKKVDPRSL